MARKNAFALVLAVPVLLFILFDLSLALFALSGFLVGSLVVSCIRFLKSRRKAQRAEPARKLGFLLPVAILVFLLASVLLYRPLKIGIAPVSHMNYVYTGTITLDRQRSTWSIQDQVTFPNEKKIDQFLTKTRARDGEPASSVADMMANAGWQREEIVGATSANYTKTRTQPAKNRLYPIHTTNSFDLPVFRAGGLVSSLQSHSSTLRVVAPKHAVSKTFPPFRSRDDLLHDDLESLPISLSSIEDVPAVRVQLLSRPLQNEWGFAISRITVWEHLKWLVTLIAGVVGGVFEDEIKKFLAPLAQRLLSWFGKKRPAPAAVPHPSPPAPTPTTAQQQSPPPEAPTIASAIPPGPQEEVSNNHQAQEDRQAASPDEHGKQKSP